MTIAVLVFALTLGTMMLAGGVVAVIWQRYGALALGARQDWTDCPQTREVRFRVTQRGLVPGGNIVALPLRAKPVIAAASPVRHRQPQRAAA
jgi:hypothetical protein